EPRWKEAHCRFTEVPMQRGPSTNGADMARSTATRPATCAAVSVRSAPLRDKGKPPTRADTRVDRAEDHAVMEIGIAPAVSQIRNARSAVRAHLGDEHYGPDQIRAVETVVSELLGAAFDSGVREQIHLSVESFTLLTSVRVHCSRNVQLRDEPFGLRER